MPAVKRATYRPVEIFEDKSGRRRFRIRAKNGRVLASSQAYAGRASARKGAAALWRLVKQAGEFGHLLQEEGEGCARTNS